VDDAKQALVFRHANQAAASWGILLDSLPDEDPAVFIRPDLADKSAERWEEWLERLSLCFVEIVLSESLHADEELCDFLDPDDGSVGLLEASCVRPSFPAYPVGEGERGSRWFLGPDVLLRDDDGAAILARGRTAEDLNRARGLIPGEWLNDYRWPRPELLPTGLPASAVAGFAEVAAEGETVDDGRTEAEVVID
jgi:hypothetical protein